MSTTNKVEHYSQIKITFLHCPGTLRRYNTLQVNIVISCNKEPVIVPRDRGGHKDERGWGGWSYSPLYQGQMCKMKMAMPL